jgi:quercetin dioxygenase-like cupin family protein
MISPWTKVRRRSLMSLVLAAAAGSLVTAAVDRAAWDQQDGVKRTILRRVADPANPNYEVVMAIAELAPGASSGKHRHPGVEVAYLLEGSLVIEHDGREAATLKTGDSLTNDNTGVHNARNPGATPARVLAVYVVDKNKPLSEVVK